MNDFERLRAIVDADEELQSELMTETEIAGFVAALMHVAVEHDLVIAEGAIHAAIEDGRQAWLSTWAP